MKTKEQIINHIGLCIFSDEDWTLVKCFCQSGFGKGFHKPFRGRFKSTYEEFKDWFNDGLGYGDMIMYGRSPAVVSYHFGDTVALCAYCGPENTIVDAHEAPFVGNYANVSELPEDKVDAFRKRMFENGWMIDPSNCKISTDIRLVPKMMYKYKFGSQVWYGVLSNYTDSEAEMYYGWNIGCTLGSCVVPISDIIEAIGVTAANDIISKMLEVDRVQWSFPNKSFMYYPVRSAKFKTYYYITDKFSITSARDTRTKLHNIRYMSGNYFQSLEEAIEYLKSIQVIRFQKIGKAIITDNLAPSTYKMKN